MSNSESPILLKHVVFFPPQVFHEMVSAGVEPNVHTYGALIDGCGRAGEVAKAFGAYGIMRSKVLLHRQALKSLLIVKWFLVFSCIASKFSC